VGQELLGKAEAIALHNFETMAGGSFPKHTWCGGFNALEQNLWKRPLSDTLRWLNCTCFPWLDHVSLPSLPLHRRYFPNGGRYDNRQ